MGLLHYLGACDKLSKHTELRFLPLFTKLLKYKNTILILNLTPYILEKRRLSNIVYSKKCESE